VNGEACTAGDCVCPGNETNETTSDDAVDNDCDGLLNCADPDCLNRTCGTAGKKCTASGTCE
jgi:hypothetical protein